MCPQSPMHPHKAPHTFSSPPLALRKPPKPSLMAPRPQHQNSPLSARGWGGTGPLPLLHQLPDGRHSGPRAQVGVVWPLILLHNLLCRKREGGGGDRDFGVYMSTGGSDPMDAKFTQMKHFCTKNQAFPHFGSLSRHPCLQLQYMALSVLGLGKF